MTDKTQRKTLAIRFQQLGKLYHFDAGGEEDLQVGDFVIVSTSRGREMAEVVDIITEQGRNGSHKAIERKATPQELVLRRMWQRRELEAMIDCRAKAAELGVTSVKIVAAEYSFDGSRLMFLYSSEGDEKPDLKELHKAMKADFQKSRVELRKVGPRDVAKILSGMGACGLTERCCSKFLTEFSPISIKMAKAQGISLNPQEITGMCGRLRCCLVYEYEQYVAARKELPKKKKRVVTPQGEGKVVEVFPLRQAVIVKLEDDRKVEFYKHELHPYEELQALKSKADEPCSQHGTENCTCGNKG